VSRPHYNAWRADDVGQSEWVALLRINAVVAKTAPSGTLMDLRLTCLLAEAVHTTRLRGYVAVVERYKIKRKLPKRSGYTDIS
jgi:hypothetical protein